MEHENTYIEVYRTYDPMEAKLIRAKLTDEEIPFTIIGDSELASTMDTFNSPLARMGLRVPIKVYVDKEFAEQAKKIIETDNSSMLDEMQEDESGK